MKKESIKTSLIGLYGYAHPEERMNSRIDKIVKSLRSKNIYHFRKLFNNIYSLKRTIGILKYEFL